MMLITELLYYSGYYLISYRLIEYSVYDHRESKTKNLFILVIVQINSVNVIYWIISLKML